MPNTRDEMNEIEQPWLAQRAEEVRASITALQRDVAPLTYLQLGWRPPHGGWSIAQVLEHLLITDASYVEELRRVLPQAPHATSPNWMPSLIGGFLVRSLAPDNTRRMPTPRRWRPGPGSRANPVAEYIALREQIIALMGEAQGKDLRRTKLRSPAAKFIRINLGDAFMALIVHTRRHLRQIERIKAHPDFPPA